MVSENLVVIKLQLFHFNRNLQSYVICFAFQISEIRGKTRAVLFAVTIFISVIFVGIEIKSYLYLQF